MTSASQEIQLIEDAIRATKEQFAHRVCRVGIVDAHKDKTIGRMIARLNELHRLKNAMQECTNAGLRMH